MGKTFMARDIIVADVILDPGRAGYEAVATTRIAKPDLAEGIIAVESEGHTLGPRKHKRISVPWQVGRAFYARRALPSQTTKVKARISTKSWPDFGADNGMLMGHRRDVNFMTLYVVLW